jgi:hypothetical protein
MTDLLILFAVAMAVSAVGWKYFVYFFSLGYGYCIAAYGNDPEYQAYVKKTPILIPFLPIYSVAKYEWLKA